MFYRRKIILALLQVFNDRLDKINLQKLLFLICEKQADPVYEFVPYLYGCYSYSAKADLSTMVKKNFLDENETGYSRKDQVDYLIQLKPEDRNLINQAFRLYRGMDGNALMKLTYSQFPYYATNSTTAAGLLSEAVMRKVLAEKPSGNQTVLFTIGYEGISLEAYLNRLIRNDIKVLVDVRNNPVSQKFGFSKGQLIKYCNALGIEYMHFAEVGIQSEFRRELKTQEDYNSLFDDYKQIIIPKTISTQEKILALLIERKRIALTCFEANICQCHRKHLAEAILRLPEWKYELMHI